MNPMSSELINLADWVLVHLGFHIFMFLLKIDFNLTLQQKSMKAFNYIIKSGV